MIEFLMVHFDAIITVSVTALGFIVSFFFTQRSLKGEIQKNKIALATQEIHTLPYDICQMMNNMVKSGGRENHAEEYSAALSKVLAYGSKDAVKIVIEMQRLSYSLKNARQEEKYIIIAAFSLLITQLKYDLTSEIISPESWFMLKMTDYTQIQNVVREDINVLVKKLSLNDNFSV